MRDDRERSKDQTPAEQSSPGDATPEHQPESSDRESAGEATLSIYEESSRGGGEDRPGDMEPTGGNGGSRGY